MSFSDVTVCSLLFSLLYSLHVLLLKDISFSDTNNVVLNFFVYTFWCTCTGVSFRCVSWLELSSRGICVSNFNFIRCWQLCSFTPASVHESSCSASLATLGIIRIVYIFASVAGEGLASYGFNLHFSDYRWGQSSIF